MKKSDLADMIREAVQNALDSEREKPEDKKARLDGKKNALEKFKDKDPETLKAAYLQIEAQAEASYQEPLKHAFLWGALDQIKFMLKKQGHGLPKKNQDPWKR